MATNLQRIKVWDPGTRLFHWLNAILVLTLITLGIIILNAKTLGITGEPKVLLKTLHVWTGYAFAINLGVRIIRAFTGNHYARWAQFLPLGKGYCRELKIFTGSLLAGKHRQYVGHNPAGRLIIGLFFLLLVSQALTGLVIAGTDLYYPPFGAYFAEWVTEGDPERLQALQPGDSRHVVEAAWEDMRAFRSPFITLHVYGFYSLLVLIFLHIAGVVVSEIREKQGLVSAMITGEKILDGPADDGKETGTEIR